MTQELKTTPIDSGDTQQQLNRDLTFGEKAAGVTFNPSKDPRVDSIKAKFAAIFDELNEARAEPSAEGEAKRYFSKAISYAEDAQMNAVKGLTWQY